MCGKAFAKPIKVENVSYGKPMIYEACPYCLTEITIEKTVPISDKQKPAMAKTREAVEEADTALELEMPKKVVQQPSIEAVDCKHHFGYLSERSKSEALPEECIVCPKIVQCMLKSVSG